MVQNKNILLDIFYYFYKIFINIDRKNIQIE